uniref:VOC domain-containing protein n=1 Tax=Leptobrachium leishanense TaxID=445787 RepID=A0A8C5R130_9ANUR
MGSRKALPYVLKVGGGFSNIRFFRELLGMTVLRHEEFEGCKATCNGPYNGKWSKTMIGSEDKQFVVELTYNYGVGEYRLGNDFKVIPYFNDTKKNALLGYADNQCKLELQDIGGPVDHGTAFGRIAFACPKEELPHIEEQMKKKEPENPNSPCTPGKTTVQVVILADPDGHEISFVGAEAFEELSQTDPNANDLLNDAMASDKSEEWFAKGKMQKPSA